MIPARKIDTAIALRALAMENSLLQSYRALFIGIEAALLASAFALSRLDTAEKVWMVGVAGLALCASWIVVCRAKGKDVDEWMKYLTKEAEGKEFFSYMEASFTLQFQGGRFAHHWFNEAMPSLIIGLWVWMIISI